MLEPPVVRASELFRAALGVDVIVIGPDGPRHRIDRRVYGQFVEHLGRGVYEGLWVGPDSPIPHKNGLRRDVVEALRAVKVPVVRWPGGCFADEYHWLKGVGPSEHRRPMVNTHWGGVVDPNEFGTHEYFELLNQLDAEAYISGNVGSGSVAEMRDWVEYMTFDAHSEMAELRRRFGREQPWTVPFFGVGNESWGCGGNMTALHYANQYRHFQTYVRDFGDNRISKIACGANGDDYEWTEVVMARAAALMDGLSLHYYTVPGGIDGRRGSATDFDAATWADTVERARAVDHLLARHGAIMDRFDPQRRVGLYVDEWGTWFDPEAGTDPGFLYQQNTVRDAVVAAIHFHAFHRHGARARMANIAQMVNVLQALLLTDGPLMVKTPTYHAFALYTDHHDAEYVPTTAAAGGIRERVGGQTDFTVSRSFGAYTISAVNASLDAESELEFELPGSIGDVLRTEVLTGTAPHAHNTFEAPESVVVTELTGVKVEGTRLRFTLPPHAVATVRVSQPGSSGQAAA